MELKEKYAIEDLISIVKRLREPDGCPWDKVQTHQSIKKSMIEETYEAIDALDNGTDHDFANELGDVLLQVVFHSVMAEEREAFDFDDVVKEICVKLITRHTHVFGKDHAGNAEEALTNWEKNKKKEKKISTYTGVLKDVPAHLPALMRAEKIQKKARGFGFDWDDITDVYAKVNEEIAELKAAKAERDIREEYGDLLFSVVNLGRFLGTDPETALTDASNKFIRRFGRMEELAEREQKDIGKLDLNELDDLWNRIKGDSE
ncbi:MAG: nucleoside triphosphate pyrophosphohydrolase [Oscillospiraceae bacterium]|nr:nucleoside triphosphate pyrophosphohydrolase [Oscillospiraceae bacterium]